MPVKSKGLVLVVDDDSIIRKAIKIKLTGLNYKIIEAVNGDEALKILESNTPDVIILDLNMPVMSGNQFLKVYDANLRYRIPHTKIIVFTNYDSPDNSHDAFRYGAAQFITKTNISLKKFLDLVEDSVEASRAKSA